MAAATFAASFCTLCRASCAEGCEAAVSERQRTNLTIKFDIFIKTQKQVEIFQGTRGSVPSLLHPYTGEAKRERKKIVLLVVSIQMVSLAHT